MRTGLVWGLPLTADEPIASSQGSPSATPPPRSTVRRDIRRFRSGLIAHASTNIPVGRSLCEWFALYQLTRQRPSLTTRHFRGSQGRLGRANFGGRRNLTKSIAQDSACGSSRERPCGFEQWPFHTRTARPGCHRMGWMPHPGAWSQTTLPCVMRCCCLGLGLANWRSLPG